MRFENMSPKNQEIALVARNKIINGECLPLMALGATGIYIEGGSMPEHPQDTADVSQHLAQSTLHGMQIGQPRSESQISV